MSVFSKPLLDMVSELESHVSGGVSEKIQYKEWASYESGFNLNFKYTQNFTFDIFFMKWIHNYLNYLSSPSPKSSRPKPNPNPNFKAVQNSKVRLGLLKDILEPINLQAISQQLVSN